MSRTNGLNISSLAVEAGRIVRSARLAHRMDPARAWATVGCCSNRDLPPGARATVGSRSGCDSTDRDGPRRHNSLDLRGAVSDGSGPVSGTACIRDAWHLWHPACDASGGWSRPRPRSTAGAAPVGSTFWRSTSRRARCSSSRSRPRSTISEGSEDPGLVRGGARSVALGRGWVVRRSHGALLLLATDAVDARLRENRLLAPEAFPGRAADLVDPDERAFPLSRSPDRTEPGDDRSAEPAARLDSSDAPRGATRPSVIRGLRRGRAPVGQSLTPRGSAYGSRSLRGLRIRSGVHVPLPESRDSGAQRARPRLS